MLLPALSRAREAARRTSCLNKVKQLGLATQFYFGDFNEYVPPFRSSNIRDGNIKRDNTWPSAGQYLAENYARTDEALWRCPSPVDASVQGDYMPGLNTWAHGRPEALLPLRVRHLDRAEPEALLPLRVRHLDRAERVHDVPWALWYDRTTLRSYKSPDRPNRDYRSGSHWFGGGESMWEGGNGHPEGGNLVHLDGSGTWRAGGPDIWAGGNPNWTTHGEAGCVRPIASSIMWFGINTNFRLQVGAKSYAGANDIDNPAWTGQRLLALYYKRSWINP
jgi:hypothetical protein